MSRMVARPRHRENFGTGMRISEYLVALIVIGLAIAGVRYYFVVYRHSPGYALGAYLGAVKKGDPEAQYALIDDDDKRKFFPTLSEYEKTAPQARGYTERISSVTLSAEKIDPKKPHIAKIEAILRLRRAGLEVYQAASDTYTDHYTLRKDREGEWKVWLGASEINMLKSAPTPAGQPL